MTMECRAAPVFALVFVAATSTLAAARVQPEWPTNVRANSSAGVTTDVPAPVSPASVSPAPASGPDASDDPRLNFTPDEQWTLRVEPSVWFVSPGGDLILPGGSGGGPTQIDRVEISDLNIDTPRLSPYGKLHLRTGNFQLGLMGFSYSIDRDATMPRDVVLGDVRANAGDVLRTGLDYASFEAEGLYRIIDRPIGFLSDGRRTLMSSVDLLAGIRVHDVAFEVDRVRGTATGPSSASADEIFVEPIVGVRGELEFDETFNVHVQLSAGYWPTEQEVLSWDVSAGFAYRPVPNLGVQIGYRQLAFRLESGEGAERFNYRGSLAGLYFGLFLRF
ncbi:MAG: hypothetical protein SFZ23_10210 [Planctomycetota bacterium]|nr:hypothetical protein [Planctomycetota bacterium]